MWVGGVCRLMDDLSRYGRWGERWRNGETDEEESMEHCNGDRGSFICLLHPTSQSLWEIGPLTSDSLHRLCLIFVIFHCLPQPSRFPTLLSFFLWIRSNFSVFSYSPHISQLSPVLPLAVRACSPFLTDASTVFSYIWCLNWFQPRHIKTVNTFFILSKASSNIWTADTSHINRHFNFNYSIYSALLLNYLCRFSFDWFCWTFITVQFNSPAYTCYSFNDTFNAFIFYTSAKKLSLFNHQIYIPAVCHQCWHTQLATGITLQINISNAFSKYTFTDFSSHTSSIYFF